MANRVIGLGFPPRQMAAIDAEKARTGASRGEIVRRAVKKYMASRQHYADKVLPKKEVASD